MLCINRAGPHVLIGGRTRRVQTIAEYDTDSVFCYATEPWRRTLGGRSLPPLLGCLRATRRLDGTIFALRAVTYSPARKNKASVSSVNVAALCLCSRPPMPPLTMLLCAPGSGSFSYTMSGVHSSDEGSPHEARRLAIGHLFGVASPFGSWSVFTSSRYRLQSLSLMKKGGKVALPRAGFAISSLSLPSYTMRAFTSGSESGS